MREGQFAEGIQLRFRSKDDVPTLLSELAVGWNSKVKKSSKNKGKASNPDEAALYTFNGGLTVCFCLDALKEHEEIYVTVPYIIVDDTKIPVSGKYVTEYDDGTGVDLLKEFVAQYWTGNSEPVKPSASRQKVKNLDNSKCPKMLIDLVSTLETFYESGMSHENLDNKQIPDYEMSVWLRQIAGDTYKDSEQFYEFLDKAREKSESSTLNGMAFDNAVIKLQSEKPAIYEFLSERGYLASEGVRS